MHRVLLLLAFGASAACQLVADLDEKSLGAAPDADAAPPDATSSADAAEDAAREEAAVEPDPTDAGTTPRDAAAEDAGDSGPCPPDMAFVAPGGTWSYVSPAGDAARKVETKPFCLDQSEVTTIDFRACVLAGACTGRSIVSECLGTNYEVPGRERHPINCVRLADAQEYCRWRGKTLPTMVQWQWAARNGASATPFPTGRDQPLSRPAEACWSAYVTQTSTCPVASFPLGDDQWHVHDLSGNVAEWSVDPVSGKAFLLGGSWDTTFAEYVESTAAQEEPSDYPHERFGFRCAL